MKDINVDKNRYSPVGIIILFCFLLIAVNWFQILSQLKEDRSKTIAAAIERNNNLVVSLEQYAIRTIRNADAVIQLVRLQSQNKGDTLNLVAFLQNGVIDLKYFNGVVVIDEKGKIKFTNLQLSKVHGIDFSDREHFNYHKQHVNNLFISKPITSRTIKEAVIVISRRINKKDGSFGGTVAVQIKPSTFTQFYTNANLHSFNFISLIAPNGITYARRTGNKESYGEDISASPLFGHVSKQAVGNYYAKDAIRQLPTFISYRKLENYPMIATVGTTEKEVLAGYYERRKKDFFFGGAITFLLLSFAGVGILVSRQRRRNIRKLRYSENKYRSIFDNSQDAIFVLSGNKIEAMNEAAFSLFHLDPNAQDITFDQLFSEATPPQSWQSLMQEQDTGKLELTFTRNDTSKFIGEIVFSKYKDAFGNDPRLILIRDVTLRYQLQKQLIREQKRYQRKLTRQIILAQEREREFIGRELHDNVNQILTTVKLYLEMSLDFPEKTTELVKKSVVHVLHCTEEIRNLSRQLSAPTLGTESLIDSINALLGVVRSSSSLNIHFSYDPVATSLHKDQKLAIYRILQEQLNNIIKHAKASEVNIVLSQRGEIIELFINDNGTGFNLQQKRKGIGLENMVSRAKVFGGNLQIESREGQGCLVHVTLPIKVERGPISLEK